MTWKYILLVLPLLLSGCAYNPFRSAGESESGYTYVPLDPFPVTPKPGTECQKTDKLSRKTLLEALPDNAVRMLIERFDVSGAVTYGSSKVGGAGETFRVTIDYIYSDTMNRKVFVSQTVIPIESYGRNWLTGTTTTKTGKRTSVPIGSAPTFSFVPGTEEYKIVRKFTPTSGLSEEDKLKEETDFRENYREYNIPVYVGVGLRASANIYSVKSDATISGLGVIGAEAEADKLRGSLIIQTLGVNGKAVAAALPIQSELNRTTAQNAIVAVGTIKALLHSEETWVAPRVVGLYLPFPGGKPLVNALISELSNTELVWDFTCFGRANNGQTQPVPR